MFTGHNPDGIQSRIIDHICYRQGVDIGETEEAARNTAELDLDVAAALFEIAERWPGIYLDGMSQQDLEEQVDQHGLTLEKLAKPNRSE